MLSKMKNAVKTMTKARRTMMTDHHHLIGTEVKITKEYRNWLKAHVEALFDGDKSDPDYAHSNSIITGKIKSGKVINSRYDREDGITLTVLLENGTERLLGLGDVVEKKERNK